MTDKIVIGIDTSNYTTSFAIFTAEGELLANVKRLLPVKPGEFGLRQSDAVFAHVKNLPIVFEEAKDYLSGKKVVAVGVSEKPRNIDGSYMPCFLTGVAIAEGIAKTHNVPLYKFSHQCGHIMAALYSSGKQELLDGEFASFHVSGGTTELLKVRGAECGFCAEIVGGTKDLNAGQVIDRIGVHLGMPFPAGAGLEKCALSYCDKIPRSKVAVSGTYANLSGLENMALKMYKETNDSAKVAAFVFDYIGRSILKMCESYVEEYGETPFVFAGGVMCNSIIRNKLSDHLEAYFAEPNMSSDNAVGIAALTLKKYLSEN